ncbi:hypothetical protein QM826_04805 [Streptococcus parasanguinis]|jgi:hypothetical protein|uniref:hypothetical protein n=1 Tax=Streptococcus parasanguinis TaxID=1318 RepID=UPI00205483CF|nr:MAG TPA: hypothetical protein [Caudoviricetes sp.]
MAQYKAICNFLIESTDQNFDEGTVYELTTAEAEEINQKTSLAFGEEWLELVSDSDSVAQKVASE